MAKSYFAILGVESNASSEEIRSAYRRLAKELHPDRVGGDSGAFRQVQEAYSFLIDEGRRHAYERSLIQSSRWAGSRRYPTRAHPIRRQHSGYDQNYSSLAALLDELSGWLGEGFPGLRPRRMQNLILEVPLTRELARQGGQVEVLVPVRTLCPSCEGHGGRGSYACARCLGQGVVGENLPLTLSFSSGLQRGQTVVVSLEQFGLRNVQLTVLLVDA